MDDECRRAFQELEVYMGTVPILSSPDKGEDLYLYMAVSEYAVSSVPIRESNGT